MAAPEQCVSEGRLAEAMAGVQERIRARPADVGLRVYLFQLLAVLGDWPRALTQLNVAGELDAAALPMVHTCRAAIEGEAVRREVFAGRMTPCVMAEPQRWLALLVEALRVDAAGRIGEAQALRAQAFELAPASAGVIGGVPFAWIADADPRFGPVLEGIVDGRYMWVPFDRLSRVHIEAPVDLRDLVWTPAHLVWRNGGESVALIPTRYPGSEASEDPQIRLARKTEWQTTGDDAWVGLGQRMLATDAGEYPLLDTRLIALDGAITEDAVTEDAGSPAGD